MGVPGLFRCSSVSLTLMMTIGEVVLNSSSVISEPAMGYSFGGRNCCLNCFLFCQFRSGERKTFAKKKPQPKSGTFLPFFVVLCELVEFICYYRTVVPNVFKVYHHIS